LNQQKAATEALRNTRAFPRLPSGVPAGEPEAEAAVRLQRSARDGFGPISEYFFWLRADCFCKHLIGDYSQSVDIDEINRDIEMSGKGGR